MSEPQPLSPTDAFTLVTGAVTLLAVSFGRLPGGMKLSRAVLALAGAVILVLGGAADLRSALASIDGEVLVLLFGLLAVNAALASAGVFRWIATFAARRALSPRSLLVVVVLTAGVLSALFLNDTVVLMLTPLLVRLALALGLQPLPYLLALAMAANAGSVATVTGNPQNVLVAVTADVSYAGFLRTLGPVAVLALAATCAVLLIAFRRELAGRVRPARHLDPPPVNRVHATIGLAATCAMLVAFAVGVPVATAARAAGTFLLVSRGPGSRGLLRQVDVSLLVLFASLFVVVGAMAATGAPQRWLLGALGAGGVFDLVWVSAALSVLLSNVPAVLVLLPVVPADSVMVVAMAATLAGNLTLAASVANLIVAESARRVGVEVGFWAYARVGVPVTLASLLIGGAWLALVGVS